MSMDNVFCPKCGSEMMKDHSYCMQCGYKIELNDMLPSRPVRKSKKKGFLFVTCMLILLAVIGVGSYYFLFMKDKGLFLNIKYGTNIDQVKQKIEDKYHIELKKMNDQEGYSGILNDYAGIKGLIASFRVYADSQKKYNHASASLVCGDGCAYSDSELVEKLQKDFKKRYGDMKTTDGMFGKKYSWETPNGIIELDVRDYGGDDLFVHLYYEEK